MECVPGLRSAGSTFIPLSLFLKSKLLYSQKVYFRLSLFLLKLLVKVAELWVILLAPETLILQEAKTGKGIIKKARVAIAMDIFNKCFFISGL